MTFARILHISISHIDSLRNAGLSAYHCIYEDANQISIRASLISKSGLRELILLSQQMRSPIFQIGVLNTCSNDFSTDHCTSHPDESPLAEIVANQSTSGPRQIKLNCPYCMGVKILGAKSVSPKFFRLKTSSLSSFLFLGCEKKKTMASDFRLLTSNLENYCFSKIDNPSGCFRNYETF